MENSNGFFFNQLQREREAGGRRLSTNVIETEQSHFQNRILENGCYKVKLRRNILEENTVRGPEPRLFSFVLIEEVVIISRNRFQRQGNNYFSMIPRSQK